MVLLILGVALWWAAHLFKRAAPKVRAEMGQSGKGAVTAALIVSVILMVIGYRAADGTVWWGPSGATKGINNLLMLVSVYFFAAAGAKTGLARKMRHPMLVGMAIWAFAHLLPNGDLPSFVLFGGLLAWVPVQMAMINRAQPRWTPPAPSPMGKEIGVAVVSLVVYGLIALVHIWLGYNPFGA